MVYSILAQAQPAAFSSGPAGLIAHSGWVARFVLLLLLVFSLISWAIILFKLFQVHRANSESDRFMDFFWKSKSKPT